MNKRLTYKVPGYAMVILPGFQILLQSAISQKIRI